MKPDVIAAAVSRQAQFLVAVKTLQTHASAEKEVNGGMFSLVKLWATIKKLDRSRKIWDGVKKVLGASADKTYMREAGNLMMRVVRQRSHCRLKSALLYAYPLHDAHAQPSRPLCFFLRAGRV